MSLKIMIFPPVQLFLRLKTSINFVNYTYVLNQNFYSAKSPTISRLLLPSATHRYTYIHETTSNLPCYTCIITHTHTHLQTHTHTHTHTHTKNHLYDHTQKYANIIYTIIHINNHIYDYIQQYGNMICTHTHTHLQTHTHTHTNTHTHTHTHT